ncbi:MAG TPA: T9SS type A sorting domain-containing protein, partial [Flavobacterium sp.]|nr:T9SS type A sorting domain-containing protein [Flavobacterium sp.]
IIEVEAGNEATIEDLIVTGEGTVTWYASEEDAQNGENALEAGTVITTGMYFVTLTVDDCESDYMELSEVLLGTNGFTKGTFTYYPNPVKDMLKLSYSEGITGVEVFNLVGQRVINIAMGQNEANVDMSSLASGTYVVKVSSGDAAAMIKVVKE